MVTIRPFRALRPRPEHAAAIAAVPYDVVSTGEARQLAEGNALSFLHVSRAEIDLPPDANPYSDAVYERALQNFAALRPAMTEEAEPAVYCYRLRMGDHVQVGLACCCSVDEYHRDIVKKHEKTRKDKEDDRTRHMIAIRAQTGPVFLTYRDRDTIDALVDRVCQAAPLYDFVAADGIGHTIWRAGTADTAALVAAFSELPAVYIADGHHRAASAARASAELLRSAPGGAGGEHAWFLAVAFPGSQTQILSYNRIVSDLAGLTPTEFLAAVRARFDVRPGPSVPARKGECAMFLDGAWYAIALRPEGAAPADPIRGLDVSLLQEGLIEPLLKVVDLRTDKRIDFVGGIRGVGELERAVASGRAAVAFSMFPVTVDELMAIADAGSIMPPKSTWFEPKLRDGLLSHLI
jgi:uncharacterized protein (DUF1015 family)